MIPAFPGTYFDLDSACVVLQLEETLRTELGTMEAAQNEIYSMTACDNGGCHGSEEGGEQECCMQCVEREGGEDGATVVRD